MSNANTNEVLRFTVDAAGALTPNGSLTGNGLNFPIGLQFTSWGELIVVDQGSASLSRFTFSGVRRRPRSDGGRGLRYGPGVVGFDTLPRLDPHRPGRLDGTRDRWRR